MEDENRLGTKAPSICHVLVPIMSSCAKTKRGLSLIVQKNNYCFHFPTVLNLFLVKLLKTFLSVVLIITLFAFNY